MNLSKPDRDRAAARLNDLEQIRHRMTRAAERLTDNASRSSAMHNADVLKWAGEFIQAVLDGTTPTNRGPSIQGRKVGRR